MNHIMIFKKAIKKQHCKNIVKLMNTTKLSIGSNPGVNTFYKGLNRNPYQQEWFKDFIKCLNKYKKKHSYLDRMVSWTIDRVCNYQKYRPNQYYKSEHHEDDLQEEKRMLAWMFYCNTIKNEGGTSFPQQKVKLKAEEGTVAIWPAGWPYSHLGIVAPTEYKYIVTGWASYVV